MTLTIPPNVRLALPLVLALMLGCASSESQVDETPTRGATAVNPADMVPVKGVVTLNGKPLTGAVVAFMPKSGVPGIGETDAGGQYELTTVTSKGALPGDYKVQISYRVSPSGKSQGLSARSAMVQSEDMVNSVEQMPPEYNDLDATKLSAKVGPEGGSINFDLQVAEAKAGAPDTDKPTDADKDQEKPKAKDAEGK